MKPFFAIGNKCNDVSNETHVAILKDLIERDEFIHTSHHYPGCFAVIKKAADLAGKKAKVIYKVYINSTEQDLREPLQQQIDSLFTQFPNAEIAVLQVCCNPDYKYLSAGKPFRRKLENLKKENIVKEIYLESFWQYSDNLKKFVKDDLFDGFIFYYNSILRELSPQLAKELHATSKKIIAMKGLGGGPNNFYESHLTTADIEKYKSIVGESGLDEYQFRLAFLKAIPNLRGVVFGTQNLERYQTLVSSFKEARRLDSSVFNEITQFQNDLWALKGCGSGEGFFKAFGRMGIQIQLRKTKQSLKALLTRQAVGHDW